MKTLFKRIFIQIRYFSREIGKKIIFSLNKEKIKLNSNTNKVYIFLAADYANMGDVAITYAQKMYINNILPEYELIEIPYKKTIRLIPFLKRTIKSQDIITIVGGGNLTNRYDGLEEARRMVIKTFKKNNIISFPQTIEFTQDILGQESLRRTKKIYSKHKNLILFARENKSYQFMKENFTKNKVFLVPDIAMLLKEKFKNNNIKRNKIGICLREDKERALKENERDKIIKICGKENIEYITTYIGDENLIYEKRYDTLYEILKKIESTEVFITDRLHGMIFCYITKTPCIAFDNDNHKIKETYNKWLKDCNYIKLLDENKIENINTYIEQITRVEKKDIDLIDEYKEIEKALLKAKGEYNEK